MPKGVGYGKNMRKGRKGRVVGAAEQADAISTAKPRRTAKKTVTGGGAVTNTYGRR